MKKHRTSAKKPASVSRNKYDSCNVLSRLGKAATIILNDSLEAVAFNPPGSDGRELAGNRLHRLFGDASALCLQAPPGLFGSNYLIRLQDTLRRVVGAVVNADRTSPEWSSIYREAAIAMMDVGPILAEPSRYRPEAVVDDAPPVALSDGEIAILRRLGKNPDLSVKQIVLARYGDLHQSEKTIGVNIQRLRELGLTARACGDRSGESITQKGLQRLARNPGN